MVLEEKEWKYFFSIWSGLLGYVNDVHKITSQYSSEFEYATVESKITLPIRNKLWEDDAIIDSYISSNKSLNLDEKQILKSWKDRVAGQFLIMKHLKNYTTFFKDDEKFIFGVNGLRHPIESFYPKFTLPIMTNTVLLPFKGKIIYDSFFETYRVRFGGNMRRSFNEEYQEIRKSKGIVTQL
ncbi:hypothetical protein FACS1894102_5740 [Spirochaetia bacterium]|nr:hypothetical protein FACS1894102_5740 [Spirochaetia bacterium]